MKGAVSSPNSSQQWDSMRHKKAAKLAIDGLGSVTFAKEEIAGCLQTYLPERC